jgi:hypothetical protein
VGCLVYCSASVTGLAVFGAAAAPSQDGSLPPVPDPGGPRAGRDLAPETAAGVAMLPVPSGTTLVKLPIKRRNRVGLP